MKKFFQSLKKRKKDSDHQKMDWPSVNIEAQIEAVRTAESGESIGLGRRIHYFPFHEFELSLDREVTGQYRVIVYEGRERRYSFTVKCKHKNYESLKKAFEEITLYLSGNRRIADLPDHEGLKGHYFGV